MSHPTVSLRRRWLLVTASLVLLASACSRWKHAESFDGWTLYRTPGMQIDVATWEGICQPALEAVERDFGPFEERVDIHVWAGGVTLTEDGRRVRHQAEDGYQDIPGIGRAQVRGYHARDGVFLGTPEAGTTVHELVHARISEDTDELPLWFEEGVAHWFGDGALLDGTWTVDGFACWPWLELRTNPLTDEDLSRLLALGPRDKATIRDNVLVHFVGWAVVFDLARETGSRDWRVWQERFDDERALLDARRRLNRTLADDTPARWIGRLQDPDPGARFATARGMWKLGNRVVLEALLTALERETHDEVRVALAVNALAAANELDLDGPTRWRAVERAKIALERAELPDVREARALETLVRGQEAGGGWDEPTLEALRRFWAE